MRPHLEDLQCLRKAYITHKGTKNQVQPPCLILDKEAMLIYTVCAFVGMGVSVWWMVNFDIALMEKWS